MDSVTVIRVVAAVVAVIILAVIVSRRKRATSGTQPRSSH